MRKLKDEISEKKLQIRVLEQRMIGSLEMTPQMSNNSEMSQVTVHLYGDGFQEKLLLHEKFWIAR